jgi:large subunit ribosomal protein L10
LAITKERKHELVDGYRELIDNSQGVILTEYRALPMGTLTQLRTAVRNSGGSVHAAKNTLIAIALRDAGLPVPTELLSGSTLVSFAQGDLAAVAKAVLDFARAHEENVTVKGGIMGRQLLSGAEVKTLAELPPLPVVRAQLIGLLQAPASRLAGVLAAPGRQIATVLKAYAEKHAEPSAEPGEAPAAEPAPA